MCISHQHHLQVKQEKHVSFVDSDGHTFYLHLVTRLLLIKSWISVYSQLIDLP